MNTSRQEIRLQKRLLQFNDLVFSFGEITSETYTASFKGETVTYTNALHGGYYPNFGEWGKLDVAEMEVTVSIDFSELSCRDDYTRYMRFIRRELGRSGKLWAVQGGTEILWANARVISINETTEEYDTNRLQLSIRFELIDGFWVLASKTRTFLAKYRTQDFEDFDQNYCYNLDDQFGCTNTTRCLPCNKSEQIPHYSSEIKYEALCDFTKSRLAEEFSVSCPNKYSIKYDCDLEKERFCYDTAWGEKKRLKKNGLAFTNETTFVYCSKTDIPTELVKITLVGTYENPTITINGQKITIEGYFENQAITIGEGLGVYLSNDPRNPYAVSRSLIDQASFDNVPFWQVIPGVNTITVTGNKYGENSFCYVKPVELTF